MSGGRGLRCLYEKSCAAGRARLLYAYAHA